MPRWIAWFVLTLAVLTCGQGCESKPDVAPVTTLLEAARTAWLAGDYPQAEAAYQRYLKEAMQTPERLEAWQRLADIAGTVWGNPGNAAAILEAALLEYGQEPAIMADLTASAASAWLLAKQPAKAAEHLRILLSMESLGPAMRVQASLELAQALVMLHDLSGAVGALRSCRQGQLAASVTAPCSLRLAGLYVDLNNPDAARAIWLDVYHDGMINAQLRGEAGFALGELAEARHDKEEARAFYTSVKDWYPNPQVIVKKLQFLDK